MNKYIEMFEKKCKNVNTVPRETFKEMRRKRVHSIYGFLIQCGEDADVLDRILEENNL